jgi:hypothetical protein
MTYFSETFYFYQPAAGDTKGKHTNTQQRGNDQRAGQQT